MDYEKLILNHLLKKYEKSTVYQSRETQTRRIMVKPAEFKKIDFEDFEQKSAFISALNHLKLLDLVDFDWIKFEKNNLVKQIWLNQEQHSLDIAYDMIGKKTTYKLYEACVERLKSYEFANYEWMNVFKEELIEKFDKTGKFGQLLSSDYKLNMELIECLIAIDKLALTPIHERVFSANNFGDSKYFQNELKGKLMTIINRYTESEDDSDSLQQVCLFKNPENLFFCGPLEIHFENGIFDASIFKQGATLLGQYVSDIKCLSSNKINSVISVENRATYELMIDEKPEDALIFYHGGFASSVKRAFLKLLYTNLPDIKYYHWSDIDLGGVRIYKGIKSLIPTIKPLLMGKEVLDKYADMAIDIKEDYFEKVKRSLQSETDHEVIAILELISSRKVKLEQEQIDVNDAYKAIIEVSRIQD